MEQDVAPRANSIQPRREALGMTQYALAKRVGISQSHLARIERGEVETPGVDVAIQIAVVLGCDVTELWPPKPVIAAAESAS